MNIEEIRGKTNSELEFDESKLRDELFGLRFKMATETSANPSRISAARRTIARIRTVMHERATQIRGQEPR